MWVTVSILNLKKFRALFITLLLAALPLLAQDAQQVEPNAGKWRTWVISSGKDYRVPPPPSPSATQFELRELQKLVGSNNSQSLEQIKFWDAGAPGYRWMDMVSARIFAGTPATAYPHRVQVYLALAMYDATVAAWESKYHYNRSRPSDLDHKLHTSEAVPNSPSYPSEPAAAAYAAAAVLAHFCPAEAQSYQDMAQQAGWSRVLAGVQYPSDFYAGKDLGQKVAEAVIAQADTDGSAAVWTGTVPTGPCFWKGTNPGN